MTRPVPVTERLCHYARRHLFSFSAFQTHARRVSSPVAFYHAPPKHGINIGTDVRGTHDFTVTVKHLENVETAQTFKGRFIAPQSVK